MDYKLQYSDKMTNSFTSLSDQDWIKFVIKSKKDLMHAITIQKNIESSMKGKKIKGCKNFAYSLLSSKDGGQITASQALKYFQTFNVDAFLNVQIHKMMEIP